MRKNAHYVILFNQILVTIKNHGKKSEDLRGQYVQKHCKNVGLV